MVVVVCRIRSWVAATCVTNACIRIVQRLYELGARRVIVTGMLNFLLLRMCVSIFSLYS